MLKAYFISFLYADNSRLVRFSPQNYCECPNAKYLFTNVSQIGMATFRKSEIWVFHTNLQPFTCLIFHVSQYRERENLKPFEIVTISQYKILFPDAVCVHR